MLKTKREETTDLSGRLRELEQLDTPRLVASRRPLDDELEPPAMHLWDMRRVVRGGGQLYVLGSTNGPHRQPATWLLPARRPAS